METKQCPKCGAKWIAGQLYWSTGKQAEEVDLAGLVCNDFADETCINPSRGVEGGQTWEQRAKEAAQALDGTDFGEL